MSVLGWFIAVVGLVLGIYGLLQMLKGKKMSTVPFRRPSEIAQYGPAVASPQGMVSTEGQAIPLQPLQAPMSGRPCLAFEITVERKWEKHEQTERGMQKRTGTDKAFEQYQGSWFQLGDGMGAVYVDVTQKPDCDLEKTGSSTVDVGMMIPGVLQFGQMQLNTPAVPQDSRTVAFVGTERILAPTTPVYVLGMLQAGPQGVAISTPPGITTGRMILSTRGREALLGSTKRNMILGYAIGATLFLGGTTLGILGPAPKGGCGAFTDTTSCDGRIYASMGTDLNWTVTQPGTYQLTVTQPNVARPIDSTLTVSTASGLRLAYNDGGSPGASARVTLPLTAGSYRVNVRDFALQTVSGGFGFHLDVVNLSAPGTAGVQPMQPMVPTQPVVPTQPAVPTQPTVPSSGGTCVRAARCCQVIAGANAQQAAACANLTRLPEAACVSTLHSYRRAVQVTRPSRLRECD